MNNKMVSTEQGKGRYSVNEGFGMEFDKKRQFTEDGGAVH